MWNIGRLARPIAFPHVAIARKDRNGAQRSAPRRLGWLAMLGLYKIKWLTRQVVVCADRNGEYAGYLDKTVYQRAAKPRRRRGAVARRVSRTSCQVSSREMKK